MSKVLTFIIVTYILLIFSGCTFTPEVLLRADKYTDTNHDSALYLLEHIKPSILKNQHDSALYYLLLVKARNRCVLPFVPQDSVINYSIVYYKKHPEGNRLAYCFFYKARMAKMKSNYDLAMNYYLKVLDVIKNSHDYILLGYVAFDQGEISLAQGDWDNSRRKYRSAYKYFEKAKNKDMAFYAIMDVGTISFKEKKYEKSIIEYREIEPLATNSMLKGALYQQLGYSYFFINKDSSLHYYRKTIHFPCVRGNMAIRYMMIGYCLFAKNKVDSTRYYLLRALTYPTIMYTRMNCYKLLVNTSFRLKDMKDLSNYMHKYLSVLDSLSTIHQQIHGKNIESLHIRINETKVAKTMNLYLYITIGLILILSVILFRYMHDRSKKEKELADETYSQQKAKMYRNVMLRKREALQEKINGIKTVNKPDKKQFNIDEKEREIRHMYDDLLHISDLPFFYKEMDISLNNLVSKLKNRYEKLNDKELCWCCLSLLDVPTYDMLILLKYNTDASLKKMKTRLAEKFHIENASVLNDFLNDIISED